MKVLVGYRDELRALVLMEAQDIPSDLDEDVEMELYEVDTVNKQFRPMSKSRFAEQFGLLDDASSSGYSELPPSQRDDADRKKIVVAKGVYSTTEHIRAQDLLAAKKSDMRFCTSLNR